VGARFSAPVQTSLGAHPASYTTGTESFPAVKQPGSGIDHPPASSVEVKEREEPYLYSTSGPSWPVIGCTVPLSLPVLLTAEERQKTDIEENICQIKHVIGKW